MCADDGIGKTAFGLLKLEDLFLYGVTRNQAVGKDLARSADAVGSVHGLCLDGWIPPRIEDEYVIRGSEVQARRFRQNLLTATMNVQ